MFDLLELLAQGDGMLWLIAIVAIVVLYFNTRSKLDRIRRSLSAQQREIDMLRAATAGEAPATRVQAPPHETTTVVTPAPASRPEAEPVPQRPLQPQAVPRAATPPLHRPSLVPSGASRKLIEQQFGGRAFVWVGGVALALAGFYLVKYSIDTGLLTEEVRVILGILFGLALLAGSYVVRANPKIANGTRIAQALAGAGIADLYGSLFAATTLYHLVPPLLGFTAMAATTVAALILSLRHGAPIAALGLIGGYATPALIEGEPNAPLLFGYLYLVFAGLTGVIRGRNWWWLSLPATLVAFAWVVLWLAGNTASQDAAWLSTFLLAVGATAVLAERRASPEETIASPSLWRRSFAPAGAVLLMGAVAYTADFGFFEWAMFALFSAGTILLAWFDDRTYVVVPWQAMGVNLVMLYCWFSAGPGDFALVLLGFAVLFAASGQLLLSRARLPLSWAGLSAAAVLFYFLLAYDRLDGWLHAQLADRADMAWTAIAFAGAIFMVWAAARTFVLSRETWLRQRLQAIFAVAATSLISLGFAILLHQEYLSFALAAEILALAWIASRIDIPALAILAQVLTALFALSVYPDVLFMLTGIADVASAADPGTLLSGALFRFALPALMFAGASVFFRRRKDDLYVKVLELGAAALLTVALYKLHQRIFLGHASEASLAIGSLFTSLLFVLGIASLRLHRLLGREALRWAGLGLGAFALLRLIGFGLLFLNPVIAHQNVGNLPLLNGLLAIYALPAILLWLAGREARLPAPYGQAVSICSYALGFVCLTLMVRQAFNGRYLDGTTIQDAEVYSYSALWLAIGVALLFVAALRKDQTMRFASLFVMLITVGKVFLYDASALTGLWRVVSFLGLGLSLLALSWFYSRFIFTSDDATPAV